MLRFQNSSCPIENLGSPDNVQIVKLNEFIQTING